MKVETCFACQENTVEGEACVPESRVLEDGLGEGLTQQPGPGLTELADPGQVSAQVDQELVVSLRDAGRLQDPLQPLPALLHTLTLCKTKTTAERDLQSGFSRTPSLLTHFLKE